MNSDQIHLSPRQVEIILNGQVRLTPRQVEMLLDRAEGAGGECIAECLGVDRDATFEAAERQVIAQIKARQISLSGLTPLGRRILADCLDASVWCALHADGGMGVCPAEQGARNSYMQAYRKLKRAGLELGKPTFR